MKSILYSVRSISVSGIFESNSFFGTDEVERAAIMEGINELNARTCLQFQPRTNQVDYVRIIVSLLYSELFVTISMSSTPSGRLLRMLVLDWPRRWHARAELGTQRLRHQLYHNP
jgi:hypothetical protein